MTLRCGTANGDITPPVGLPMGGYAARVGCSEGTLDRLNCRVLVCDDGSTAVVLVALDLLCVAAPWSTALRQRVAAAVGTDVANILVAATHTHAGPAVFRSARRATVALAEYESRLSDLVIATVRQAGDARQPAQLAFGTTRVPGVGSNRTDPTRVADDAVRVLVVQAPEARCMAVVATYGCHPTVLPPANLHYSRDLFGAAVDTAEAILQAPVLLFNGAAADVSTRFTRRAQDATELTRLGEQLGAAMCNAVRAAAPVANTPIRGGVEDVAIRLHQLPDIAEARRQVDAAAARLQRLEGDAVGAGERRRAAADLEGAQARLFWATHGGAEGALGHRPETAPLQLLQLGGVDMLGVPGELFSEVGRTVCATRARPTLLVGYANDYLGYFVDPETAAAGGYEALVSFVEPASARAIARRLATIE